jgi:hypothetical protein
MDNATIENLWRDIQDTDNGGFLQGGQLGGCNDTCMCLFVYTFWISYHVFVSSIWKIIQRYKLGIPSRSHCTGRMVPRNLLCNFSTIK